MVSLHFSCKNQNSPFPVCLPEMGCFCWRVGKEKISVVSLHQLRWFPSLFKGGFYNRAPLKRELASRRLTEGFLRKSETLCKRSQQYPSTSFAGPPPFSREAYPHF